MSTSTPHPAQTLPTLLQPFRLDVQLHDQICIDTGAS